MFPIKYLRSLLNPKTAIRSKRSRLVIGAITIALCISALSLHSTANGSLNNIRYVETPIEHKKENILNILNIPTPATNLPPTTQATTQTPDCLCPREPPGLLGFIPARMDVRNWTDLEADHPELYTGGSWRPKHCVARNRVAILIPYRDRPEHLRIFLDNIHAFLQKQQHDYRIYVVEQNGSALFNRASLLNVAFKEAVKDYDWQCFAFHDVDNIPLNDKNIYSCPDLPRQMATSLKKSTQIKVPYKSYMGGVSIMKREHFEKINGMSNMYWGWGAEDDDLYRRCKGKGLFPVQRSPFPISRYATITTFHQSAQRNEKRRSLLRRSTARQDSDGLNSVKYRVIRKEYNLLYTHIVADISMMENLDKKYLDQFTTKTTTTISPTTPTIGQSSKLLLPVVGDISELHNPTNDIAKAAPALGNKTSVLS